MFQLYIKSSALRPAMSMSLLAMMPWWNASFLVLSQTLYKSLLGLIMKTMYFTNRALIWVLQDFTFQFNYYVTIFAIISLLVQCRSKLLKTLILFNTVVERIILTFQKRVAICEIGSQIFDYHCTMPESVIYFKLLILFTFPFFLFLFCYFLF